MRILIVCHRTETLLALGRALDGIDGVQWDAVSSCAEGRVFLDDSYELALLSPGCAALQVTARNRSIATVVVHGPDDRAGATAAAGTNEVWPADDGLRERLVAWSRRSRLPVGEPQLLHGLAGDSAACAWLRQEIDRLAGSSRPLLITGPAGAGKRLAARALHAAGDRRDAPLLVLDCATATAIEAISGASVNRLARPHGTLLLDEIGELPLPLQGRLLPLLAPTSWRLVATTRLDLERAVERGRFRADLFHRLNVLEMHVPALQRRRDDIPALVSHFLTRSQQRVALTPEALAHLQGRHWPGNIAELRQLLERLPQLTPPAPVTAAMVQALADADAFEQRRPILQTLARQLLHEPVADKLQAARQALVAEALAHSRGNKAAAARLLGVHRRTVERGLKDAATTAQPGDGAPPHDL